MEIEKYDFHMHTSLCDGKNTPEEMVKAAIEKGMKVIGFSGHMDPSCGVAMDIANYVREINDLKERHAGRIDILLGGEVDCLFDIEKLPELEYRIGSTHSLRTSDGREFSVDDTPEVLKSFCEECYDGDYYKLSRAFYDTEAEILERVRPDFIGHFDLVTRFNDELHFIDEEDPRYLKPALEVMELIVNADVPFEINCGAVSRGRKADFYPNSHLLKALHEMGGRILVTSDAHEMGKIGASFKEAAKKARECGFETSLVFHHDPSGRVCAVEIPLE